MPYDKKTSPPEDASSISILDAHEVEYWARKCVCTKEELVAAVQKVGVVTFLVEAELRQVTFSLSSGKRHLPANPVPHRRPTPAPACGAIGTEESSDPPVVGAIHAKVGGRTYRFEPRSTVQGHL